jgi:hypothetical protein
MGNESSGEMFIPATSQAKTIIGMGQADASRFSWTQEAFNGSESTETHDFAGIQLFSKIVLHQNILYKTF